MFIAALASLYSVSGPAGASAPATFTVTWTTLGTAGGPVVFAERSQPANLLTTGQSRWIVDCGDGCVERLAAANVTATQVEAVLISHLHQDHTAGLAGLIGLRWMQSASTPITIYGPPGIEAMVDGIRRALAPSERIGLPSGGRSPVPLAEMIKVVTLRDDADVTANGVRIRAVRNSHFDEDGIPADNGTESLSYRFDVGAVAIGYTGDTGPSGRVIELFKGTALIVSEAADLRSAAAAINAPNSPVPIAARAGLLRHIAEHHVTPEQAGTIAVAAHARCLVLTHLSISEPTSTAAPRLEADARHTFAGNVTVAQDLDRFAVPPLTDPLPARGCKLR